MKAKTVVFGGLAAGGGGAAVLLRRKMDPRRIHSDGDGATGRDRWHVVTIYRAAEEVMPGGRLPEPLAELGDEIEVQVRPAPGDRGTELAARLRAPAPTGVTGAAARLAGDDPRQAVRAALRAAKAIIETGEVLQPDDRPSTRRTITNLPLELATSRARGEGRL
ncbi:MAG: hypothetical protein QOC64_1007 [Solirubrobacteraceae bacterium]|jgi:hypothetical protein|nr:hypothetical protein [Solirubrobacteraceae bacterium]